jgi:hypothetical protein
VASFLCAGFAAVDARIGWIYWRILARVGGVERKNDGWNRRSGGQKDDHVGRNIEPGPGSWRRTGCSAQLDLRHRAT